MKRERLGVALSCAPHKDFWKQVQNISKSSKGPNSTAPIVDGCSSDTDISNAFATKLQSLLNTRTSHSRSELFAKVESSLSFSDLASTLVSNGTVSDALSCIKAVKSDGSTLSSNHFIYASSSLTDFLAKLFTAMLWHGYVPYCLRNCILQPIPKPEKYPSDSDSYQSIALAPTLSKVFEFCVLLDYSSSFSTSPLQFGFKRGLSSDLCTGLLKNIIGRFNVRDSTVYGCFLDASKAFDRVDHSLLFDKLLKRNLSPVVARTLIGMVLSTESKHFLESLLCLTSFLLKKWCSPRWGSLSNSVYNLYR